MRSRVLQRLPILGMGFGFLLVAIALLLWAWTSRTPEHVLDLGRSTVTLDTTHITNDGQPGRLSITLLDRQGHPLRDEAVRVVPSQPFMSAVAGRTNNKGQLSIQTSVRQAARHLSASSGEVLLRVIDGKTGQRLSHEPRLRVFNRVAVLLQGLGTTLHCRDRACLPSMFRPLVGQVLQPLGYTAGGAAPTILQYSYRGGLMAEDHGYWRWLAQDYDTCDTVQTVDESVQALRAMLLAYHARYPYTSFELLGHSLGGLVALQAVGYSDFLHRIGPYAIDKVITIDSPVNGISFDARTWLLDSVAGAWHLLPCSGQRFGLDLLSQLFGLGDAAPDRQHRWAAATHAAGVAVLNITNRRDAPMPEQYAMIDDDRRVSIVDRLRYSVAPLRTLGHGALLYPTLDGMQPNPVWGDFTSTLRRYLSQPCLAFAPSGSRCRYPSLDGGY